MLIKKPSDIAPSEITPESIYLARRDFMRGAMSVAALGLGVTTAPGIFAAPTHTAEAEVRKGVTFFALLS